MAQDASHGFEQWIAGSAFVDERGMPQVWCHGTDADEFNVFARTEDFSIGFHFGTPETAANRLEQIECGDAGRLIVVHCRAKAPLRLHDHHTWSMRSIVGDMEDRGIVDADTAEAILESEDDAWIFAALELAGHDCIVYRNDTEKGGDSLLIWRSELVKDVRASNHDREDPRLMPQLGVEEVDMRIHACLRASIEAAKLELLALERDAELAP